MLDGLRVVEISQLIAGPLCSLQLQDWGAEVIKVESPEGEYNRHLEPFLPSGQSGYFQMLNRGKRSVTVDFRSPDGQELLRRLIGTADVVVEGTPGLERPDKPGQIWCSITGYGHGSKARTLDPALQASMGMMALAGDPDGPPMRLSVPLVDFMTGMYATQSVLAALVKGEGAFLDCAMVDAASTLASSVGVFALSGTEPPLRRMGTQNRWFAPAANFEAGDGQWVQIITVADQHWRALCRGLGREEWIDDERFADNSARVEHRELLHGLVAEAIREQPAQRWQDVIGAAGGFCQRIREIEEAWADPMLDARGLRGEYAGPDAYPIPTASLARTGRPEGEALAPKLGEHTEAVRAELGL